MLSAAVGLGGAWLGRFEPRAAALGGLAASALVAGVLWRSARARGWVGPSAPDLTAVVIALLGAAALRPVSVPWPAFYDASWYLNGAAAIERYGALEVQPESLAALGPESAVVATLADAQQVFPALPADAGRGFHAVAFTRNRAGATTVTPYHPPLWTAWLAVARSAAPGTDWLLTGPWALALLLAVAAVAAAAFGSWSAPLAVAALALGPLVAYYGATPYAEPAAGALALAGLAALCRLAMRERAAPWLAALAALALCTAVVAKFELAVAVPVAALWWWTRRWPIGGTSELGAAVAGASVPALVLVLLAIGPSSTYVAVNASGVAALVAQGAWAPLALGVALVALVAFLLRRAAGRGRAIALRAAEAVGWLLVVGLAVATLTYAADADAPTARLTSVVLWSAGPLVCWAAATGALLVIRRRYRPAEPLLWFAVVLTLVLLVLPGITRSLSVLYTARRFLPLVVPALTVLGAGGAVYVLGWHGASPPRASARVRDGVRLEPLVGAAVAVALIGLAAAAAPVRGRADFAGGDVLIGRLAQHVPDQALVLFPSHLGATNTARLAAPLWLREGKSTAVLASPAASGDDVARLIAAWAGRGPVLYVADAGDDVPEVPGFTAVTDSTEQWVTEALAPDGRIPPRFSHHAFDLRVVRFEADSG